MYIDSENSDQILIELEPDISKRSIKRKELVLQLFQSPQITPGSKQQSLNFTEISNIRIPSKFKFKHLFKGNSGDIILRSYTKNFYYNFSFFKNKNEPKEKQQNLTNSEKMTEKEKKEYEGIKFLRNMQINSIKDFKSAIWMTNLGLFEGINQDKFTRADDFETNIEAKQTFEDRFLKMRNHTTHSTQVRRIKLEQGLEMDLDFRNKRVKEYLEVLRSKYHITNFLYRYFVTR